MLSQRSQAETGSRARVSGKDGRRVETDAVILNSQKNLTLGKRKCEIDAGGARVTNDIRQRFLRGAVDEDFDFRHRIDRERAGLDGSGKSLGNAAQIPEPAQGLIESEALPLGRMETATDRADLIQGFGCQVVDAGYGLLNDVRRIDQVCRKNVGLDADGGEQLTNSGMELASEVLTLAFELAKDAFAGVATPPSDGSRQLIFQVLEAEKAPEKTIF